MHLILRMLIGYIIHDAVQPTMVGQVLDEISLPADLLVPHDETQVTPAGGQLWV